MTFAQAAVAQYDVVRLLLLRETRTQHPDSRLGYLWSVVDPTMWVVLFYLAFVYGGRGDLHHGMDVLPYLTTGVCTFKAFQGVAGSIPLKLPTRLLALPQVTVLDVFLSKALLEAMTMCIVFVLLVGGATLLTGRVDRVDEPLFVVAGMALAIALGFGYGLLLTAAQRVTKLAGTIGTVMSRVLFWTSGMFFVAEDLPSAARELVLYNPVLHAVELVRGGWFLDYRAKYADPMYALSWAVALLMAGLTIERLTRERQ